MLKIVALDLSHGKMLSSCVRSAEMTDLERVVTLIAELALFTAAVTRNTIPASSETAREHIWRKSEELRAALKL